MFKKTTLENGLRIITAPMKGTNTVTVLVLCGTGSDYESKEINGISHFLEHMFFKGTEKRPDHSIVAQELDGMGSVYNAFTSHEITGYYIKAGKTYLEKSLEILSDIYRNSLLKEEDIEREKQVIIEELHKDRDMPMLYVGWLWEQLLYGNQPAGWDVIGSEETIRNMKRQQFVDYFYHQYVASNTAIVVAGNFEEPATTQLIKDYFGGIRHTPPIRKKSPFQENQSSPALHVEYKETDQTHLIIGFRGYAAVHPRRYAADVLGALLGSGMSSRMFSEIRERLGLAYVVASDHDSYSNRGYLTTYAGVDHGKVEKTMRAVLNEYKRLCDEPVRETELKKVKDYIRGTTLIGLEASNAVASFVGGEEMLTGTPMTIDEVFAKIDAVSSDDICAVAKETIRLEKLSCAMIGPIKNQQPLEKILADF